ncbi:hypothetical protein PGT21_012283 [Puccinia graminis f. sp. tritici]|uniref:Uncharacterized protein n=1 Tax=Puccinia graminis f. sp. tritici TaxID=56615 RepID=A0A5B0MDJ9_PUCGR|nr:hypothetical protein PGTUg99_005932 [Puccinia graminis f. sp. tritici]KAA1090736.1 hypothetical protein PGT21_012283 [Puccinia graminis f. sp. tritici]
MFSPRFLGSLMLIFALIGTSLQLGTWETVGCAHFTVGKENAPNMACLDKKTGVYTPVDGVQHCSNLKQTQCCTNAGYNKDTCAALNP